MSTRLLAILPLLVACGGSVDSREEVTPTASTSTRFVGRWVVTEAERRALSPSAIYAFSADGRIELLRATFGQSFGAAVSPDGKVTCSLGDRWGANDDTYLVIKGTCSDNVERPITIRFLSDRASNGNSEVFVALASVAGEQGWREPKFGISFFRCDLASSCLP